MLRIEQRRHAGGRFSGCVAEVRFDEAEGQAAVLEAGRLDHLLDQLIHLGDLGGHHDRRLATALVEVPEQPALEHGDVAADHRHRSTKLVRREVEELRLVALDRGHALGDTCALEPGRDGRCVRLELGDFFTAE